MLNMSERTVPFQLTNNPEDTINIPKGCADCPKLRDLLRGPEHDLGILRDVANRPGDSALATQIVIELVDQGHSGPEAEEILKPASRELGELAAWLLQKELGETEDQVAVVTRGCPGATRARFPSKRGSAIEVTVCENDRTVGFEPVIAPDIELVRVERSGE